jgi:hypothetical protein
MGFFDAPIEQIDEEKSSLNSSKTKQSRESAARETAEIYDNVSTASSETQAEIKSERF